MPRGRADELDADEHAASCATHRRPWSPELELCRALLDLTCADRRHPDPAIRAEARAWFASGCTSAFSFVFVADHLGIDRRAFLARLDGLVGGICARRRATVRKTRTLRPQHGRCADLILSGNVLLTFR